MVRCLLILFLTKIKLATWSKSGNLCHDELFDSNTAVLAGFSCASLLEVSVHIFCSRSSAHAAANLGLWEGVVIANNEGKMSQMCYLL